MIRKLTGTVLTIAAVLLAGLALAQEGNEPPQMTPEQMAEMEAYMKAGTATREMALDGRVLMEELTSSMMGYDNVTGKYWSTWTDSMFTGLMVSEGTCPGVPYSAMTFSNARRRALLQIRWSLWRCESSRGDGAGTSSRAALTAVQNSVRARSDSWSMKTRRVRSGSNPMNAARSASVIQRTKARRPFVVAR
jgi:hypothetical protein